MFKRLKNVARMCLWSIPQRSVLVLGACVLLGLAGADTDEDVGYALDMLVIKMQATPVDVFQRSSREVDVVLRSLRQAHARQGGSAPSADYVSQLIECIEALQKKEGYESIVLACIARRMFAESFREHLRELRSDAGSSDWAAARAQLRRTRVRLSDLRVLGGADMPALPASADAADWLDALCTIHGLESRRKWLVAAFANRGVNLSRLLVDRKPMVVFHWVMLTDMIIGVKLDGTIEFLERGGDISLIRDMNYFDSIITYAEASEFDAPAFGLRRLYPSHILSTLDRDALFPKGWMTNVFE